MKKQFIVIAALAVGCVGSAQATKTTLMGKTFKQIFAGFTWNERQGTPGYYQKNSRGALSSEKHKETFVRVAGVLANDAEYGPLLNGDTFTELNHAQRWQQLVHIFNRKIHPLVTTPSAIAEIKRMKTNQAVDDSAPLYHSSEAHKSKYSRAYDILFNRIGWKNIFYTGNFEPRTAPHKSAAKNGQAAYSYLIDVFRYIPYSWDTINDELPEKAQQFLVASLIHKSAASKNFYKAHQDKLKAEQAARAAEQKVIDDAKAAYTSFKRHNKLTPRYNADKAKLKDAANKKALEELYHQHMHRIGDDVITNEVMPMFPNAGRDTINMLKDVFPQEFTYTGGQGGQDKQKARRAKYDKIVADRLKYLDTQDQKKKEAAEKAAAEKAAAEKAAEQPVKDSAGAKEAVPVSKVASNPSVQKKPSSSTSSSSSTSKPKPAFKFKFPTYRPPKIKIPKFKRKWF